MKGKNVARIVIFTLIILFTTLYVTQAFGYYGYSNKNNFRIKSVDSDCLGEVKVGEENIDINKIYQQFDFSVSSEKNKLNKLESDSCGLLIENNGLFSFSEIAFFNPLLNKLDSDSDLSNYNWEFNLLESPQLNAWCMPGGKVAVYTGILPITQNETGLAVVMGHEVSHALAGHGNERISQTMIAQYGGAILGSTISNGQWAQIFEQVYPIGAQVGLLAYGRKQELEADQMGLYLMGMAGYDPRQAIPFWNRMEAASANSQRPPEFLSTHPGPENRISGLNKFMDQALQYYRAAGGKM